MVKFSPPSMDVQAPGEAHERLVLAGVHVRRRPAGVRRHGVLEHRVGVVGGLAVGLHRDPEADRPDVASLARREQVAATQGHRGLLRRRCRWPTAWPGTTARPTRRPAQWDPALSGRSARRSQAERRRRTEEAAITGRIALVGGGATGIGRAVAEHLAASGHRVSSPAAAPTCWTPPRKQIHDDTGAEVDAVVADVSAPDSAAALYEVERRHGGVDVLVLNAGGPPPGRILQVTDEQWRAGVRAAGDRPAAAGPPRAARRWRSGDSAAWCS